MLYAVDLFASPPTQPPSHACFGHTLGIQWLTRPADVCSSCKVVMETFQVSIDAIVNRARGFPLINVLNPAII